MSVEEAVPWLLGMLGVWLFWPLALVCAFVGLATITAGPYVVWQFARGWWGDRKRHAAMIDRRDRERAR